MNRLTEKEEGGFDLKTYKPIDCESIGWDAKVEFTQLAGYEGCLRKLGKLEDVEEKLGIDLITLFKALKDGFYVRGEDHKNTSKVSLVYNFYDDKQWALLTFHYGYEADIWLYLKDYGKTWALTKEELEK